MMKDFLLMNARKTGAAPTVLLLLLLLSVGGSTLR